LQSDDIQVNHAGLGGKTNLAAKVLSKAWGKGFAV